MRTKYKLQLLSHPVLLSIERPLLFRSHPAESQHFRRNGFSLLPYSLNRTEPVDTVSVPEDCKEKDVSGFRSFGSDKAKAATFLLD